MSRPIGSDQAARLIARVADAVYQAEAAAAGTEPLLATVALWVSDVHQLLGIARAWNSVTPAPAGRVVLPAPPARFQSRRTAGEVIETDTGQRFLLGHTAADCADGGACPFHNPSDHPLRKLPMQIRETGLVERRCEHGVGHPDPDSAAFFDQRLAQPAGTWSTHGCDGCCHASSVREGGDTPAPAVTHALVDCDGMPCPFHDPSHHPLRDRRALIRGDGLTLRICDHGQRHPDPDSVAYLALIDPSRAWSDHECDGCCRASSPREGGDTRAPAVNARPGRMRRDAVPLPRLCDHGQKHPAGSDHVCDGCCRP